MRPFQAEMAGTAVEAAMEARRSRKPRATEAWAAIAAALPGDQADGVAPEESEVTPRREPAGTVATEEPVPVQATGETGATAGGPEMPPQATGATARTEALETRRAPEGLEASEVRQLRTQVGPAVAPAHRTEMPVRQERTALRRPA